MYGKVKWFNDTKGYGFITPSDGSADVFVHYTAINSDPARNGDRRTLAEGQSVEFDVEKGPKGLRATGVVLA